MAYTQPVRPGANVPYTTDYYGNPIDGTATGSANGKVDAYIPIVFSRKMLKDFYASTVFSEISNTDYEGEIKSGGDKVYIRRVPTLSIGDYVVGGNAGKETDETTISAGGIVYEMPKEGGEVLNIDQAKYWAFQMDTVDMGQTDLNLVNEFSANAAEQLKLSVDREVLGYFCDPSLCDSNNQGVAAGAITGSYNMGADLNGSGRLVNATDGDADNILNVIVEMNAVLDENNIPMENRWCVLPASMCALLKKGDLRRADITGDATGVIRTGLIGMIDNMKIYKSNQLPAATVETEAFLIPFGITQALTFAGQITKTETGQLEKSFGKYWRGLFVYGRSVVQPKAYGVAVLKVTNVA
jgi:hypothetical protein